MMRTPGIIRSWSNMPLRYTAGLASGILMVFWSWAAEPVHRAPDYAAADPVAAAMNRVRFLGFDIEGRSQREAIISIPVGERMGILTYWAPSLPMDEGLVYRVTLSGSGSRVVGVEVVDTSAWKAGGLYTHFCTFRVPPFTQVGNGTLIVSVNVAGRELTVYRGQTYTPPVTVASPIDGHAAYFGTSSSGIRFGQAFRLTAGTSVSLDVPDAMQDGCKLAVVSRVRYVQAFKTGDTVVTINGADASGQIVWGQPIRMGIETSMGELECARPGIIPKPLPSLSMVSEKYPAVNWRNAPATLATFAGVIDMPLPRNIASIDFRYEGAHGAIDVLEVLVVPNGSEP